MVKVAIITYSTYGHILSLAKVIQQSVIDAGAEADLLQVPETLSEDLLKQIYAAPKDESIPIITADDMTKYDAFLFGFPTRFGNVPAQFSSFLDSLGGLWASGALFQKPAGVFVSTGTPGGGQEITIRNFLSFLAHHGMIYVPLGYGPAFPALTSFEEVHGGSPWGAGMYAGGDGSRSINETEIQIGKFQGEAFVSALNKLVGPKTEAAPAAEKPAGAEEKARTKQVTKETKPSPSPSSDDGMCGLKCIVM